MLNYHPLGAGEKNKNPGVPGIFGFSCEYQKFLEGFKSVDMLEKSQLAKVQKQGRDDPAFGKLLFLL
jgi:hypothetical protein